MPTATRENGRYKYTWTDAGSDEDGDTVTITDVTITDVDSGGAPSNDCPYWLTSGITLSTSTLGGGDTAYDVVMDIPQSDFDALVSTSMTISVTVEDSTGRSATDTTTLTVV